MLERAAAAQDACDLGVGDHPRQPVATQQDQVVGLNRNPQHVDIDAGLGPQGAGNHRALRVPLGLGWCQRATAHELAHERMVVGQLLEAPGPKQIRARVADVPEHQGITIEHGCGDRGPHAEQRGVILGGGVNPQVDVLNGMGQRLFSALKSMESGDGHCASDLARARTAHPVGDSKDGV